MAGTYSQIHIQTVFAVKYRLALLEESWEDRLQKYITAIIQNHGHKMLAINNVKDHIHLFFGLRPVQSVSNLMQIVKGESSTWINEQRFTNRKFQWQGGFGAFSYERSQVDRIVRYVMNQKEHHKIESMQDEYHRMLAEADIEFDIRYTFHSPID